LSNQTEWILKIEIDVIVRELEKISAPMQLSVLDFIRPIGSSNITAAQDQTETAIKNDCDPGKKRRTTSILIAGKGKMLGDIVSPIIDEQDWGCLI
jgi:hypothetical protein